MTVFKIIVLKYEKNLIYFLTTLNLLRLINPNSKDVRQYYCNDKNILFDTIKKIFGLNFSEKSKSSK